MHRHNSSLEYEFIVPDRSLTDFVYCFSMLKNMQSINDIILIPNARIDLFFVKELDNQFRIVLVGFETKPSLLPKNDHACIYIVSFNPLAVEYIFKHTVSCILDSQKTLPDNFWGFNVDDLDDFEAFCTKISKKIQSLCQQKSDERKRKLFELIYASNGEVLVKQLSLQVFWSTRQINQYFNHQFGISLKTYCNILRFQASLSHIKEGKLFPQLNYYDQSHFIKEIKKLSGALPKDLFKNKNSRFLQLLAIGPK